MSWAVGYDDKWQRDIGYGVPAYCDHPGCKEEIDRGLSYVCCDQQPYGGEEGCGLYFCAEHSDIDGRCRECRDVSSTTTFIPSPDHPVWINHKLTDESWQRWRDENPEAVAALTLSGREAG